MNIIEEKGLKPDIIDYALASTTETEITSSCISVKNNLDWGGNEGIYLDLSLQIFDDWSEKIEIVSLGTIKTLYEDAEAMSIMGTLLGNLIWEVSEYVKQNSDDFTWTGVNVTPVNADGKENMTISCRNMEIAEREAKKLLEKYPSVKIRDNETREEKILNQEENNNV